MARSLQLLPDGLILGSALVACVAACGGGATLTRSGANATGGFEVQVSAGAPVTGATVTVYAVGDATGEVNTSAGDGGVIGAGGPTDATGHATVKLTAKAYSGPIQVVASGATMSYQDPAAVVAAGQAAPQVRIPASFVLSSYVPQWKLGTDAVTVPVSFFTTLADHEALAYVRGKHSAHPGSHTLSEALSSRDGLFVAHMTTSAQGWNPATLRTTVPATLSSGPVTLVDTAFAALFDVALNQLARDTAAQAGYGADSTALTASTLAQLLEEDLDADGQFDGKGLGGRTLTTLGATPVVLDAQFLRVPLARALDNWVRNTSVNASGLRQADLVGAQVYTAITQDRSDLFGAPPDAQFDPVDRDAPTLAFVIEPPVYTNATTLTLQITAADATGVKAVYALVGSQRYSGRVQPDGSWVIGVNLPVEGHNIITVWAEDSATPSTNSGFGGDATHQLTRDVLRDTTPPAVNYDATFASYQDERSLTLNTDARGVALVPASYAAGPRTAIPLGGEIWKAATRLDAGAGANATELETANAQNVPLLRFVVSVNANAEAPLVRADFTAHLTCASGCDGLADATGALVRSPSSDGQRVVLELPVAREYIPGLAGVVGPAHLSVSLALADAAGNASAPAGFEFTFHLLGPALALAEDNDYPAAGKGDSTYPYRLVDNTYAQLWAPTGGSSIFAGYNVHLKRFIVSNPTAQQVGLSAAFAQAAGGSWKALETWTRFRAREPGSTTLNNPGAATAFSIDGFVFHQVTYWSMSGTPYGSVETAPYPCSSTTAGNPMHPMGNNAVKYVCSSIVSPDPVLDAASERVYSATDVSLAVTRPAAELAGQERSPDMDATGRMYLVPPATGATPGTLVIYLMRPANAGRTRKLSWNLAAAAPLVTPAIDHYQTWDWEYFNWTGSWFSPYVDYNALRVGEYLSTSREILAGSLGLTTQPSAASSLLGEGVTRAEVSFAGETFATH